MILDRIAQSTKIRVEKLKREKPFEAVKEEALSLQVASPFLFEKAITGSDISFICEVKKASPSKGVISEDFPYIDIALDYEGAGAAAISVLTEPEFFLGGDKYLSDIAAAVKIPLLRKDFTIDPYQIYEAKIIGASAVLLICTLLSEKEIADYIAIADSLGLSSLVEAHDEREVKSALKAGARIIGVNNRDLKTFQVDLMNSVRLRHFVPKGVLFISESGIRSKADIDELRRIKADGVLIGEAFMRSSDKTKTLDGLRGDNV